MILGIKISALDNTFVVERATPSGRTIEARTYGGERK